MSSRSQTCTNVSIFIEQLNHSNSNQRTLRPDQYYRNFRGIPIMGHFIEIIGDCIVTDFVVETEHEDHRVHPSRELQQTKEIL